MASNIVAEWLRSLHLGQYAESFIDNGYDDLEICKQVGDPDLDAIGVLNPVHRSRLLQSVRTLREEGAASVYFTLEETAAIHEECLCDNDSVDSSDTYDKDSDNRTNISPPLTVAENTPEVTKFVDEYEEGKAELVKIPRIQLKFLLHEKLKTDGVRLSCQPYSTPEGERGYLEGLASRYADLYNTHYGDVLVHLEELRRLEWDQKSPKEKNVITPESPPASCSIVENGTLMTTGHSMTSSQSQPIYVPGKYSPSSCMSDKDEDEIYGFGYGLFAKQINKQKARLTNTTTANHQPYLLQQQYNYQACLSPRSAYFYEFPPNEQNYTNTYKKKTTFSRFLRSLKTSHRKEKHGTNSPKHGRGTSTGIPQRIDTPDSVLHSGLGLNDLGQHTALRSMVDPRDYERLRNLQLIGPAPNSFEETIYKLKVQDAIRQRERFTKDHEEILKDIKHSLMQIEKEGVQCNLQDDTYMYDEDARILTPGAQGYDRSHWYDEPPYESDPEDFLMGNGTGPTATIENGRVCFTLNLRNDSRGEGVISLKTAGDISLPKESPSTITPKGTPRRGLILPQAGYPPTIIPLRSSRDRENGDFTGSDVHNVVSKLSTLPVDVNKTEQHLGQLISDQYYSHLKGRVKNYKKSITSNDKENRLSPEQSSEDDVEYANPDVGSTNHMTSNERCPGLSGIAEKVRNLRNDVQKKISRLKGEPENNFSDGCPTSSIESIPSGSGSTQALVRATSDHSFVSPEEIDGARTKQVVGQARALVDQVPSPYDKEALKFKAGDLIDITSMNPSGLWRGICRGRKGTFKFINVEVLTKRSNKVEKSVKWRRNIKGKPRSVEELLQKINLQEYISVFVLNGYEHLELFKEIEPSDLDYLGIIHSDHRTKILTAVQYLHELDSDSEIETVDSTSDGDESHKKFNIHPEDLDPSLKNAPLKTESNIPESNIITDEKNNLDSIVEKCNNEILARVKQAHKKSKEEMIYMPNISTLFDIRKKPKDSYVSLHGHTMLKDPCRKSISNRQGNRKVIDDVCEADQTLSTVKFMAGGTSESGTESHSLNILGRSCLSEKSSDSGVSSSSLSSGNIKDHRQTVLSSVTDNCLDGTSLNIP